MIDEYEILINNKNQNQFFLMKKEKKGISYFIFINEIEAIPNDKGKIIIPIIIYEKKNPNKKNLNNNAENNYIIEIDINEKSCLFLFDYSLKPINENYKFIKIVFFQDRQKLFNEDFSIFEKFFFFYNNLLGTKTDISLCNQYYIELSNSFIKQIKKSKEKETINIELIIFILIISLYEKNFFSFTYLIYLNIIIIYF